MSRLQSYFPVIAAISTVLLILIVGLALLVPTPTHQAFQQSSNSGIDLSGLPILVGYMVLVAFGSKKIWDWHVGFTTNR